MGKVMFNFVQPQFRFTENSRFRIHLSVRSHHVQAHYGVGKMVKPGRMVPGAATIRVQSEELSLLPLMTVAMIVI